MSSGQQDLTEWCKLLLRLDLRSILRCPASSNVILKTSYFRWHNYQIEEDHLIHISMWYQETDLCFIKPLRFGSIFVTVFPILICVQMSFLQVIKQEISQRGSMVQKQKHHSGKKYRSRRNAMESLCGLLIRALFSFEQ